MGRGPEEEEEPLSARVRMASLDMEVTGVVMNEWLKEEMPRYLGKGLTLMVGEEEKLLEVHAHFRGENSV